MGASFGDMMVGMVTGGVAGGANAYEKVMEKQQTFTMQQMLDESKALREEHMAEVNKKNSMEVNKANVINQTEATRTLTNEAIEAEKAATGEGGYKREYAEFTAKLQTTEGIKLADAQFKNSLKLVGAQSMASVSAAKQERQAKMQAAEDYIKQSGISGEEAKKVRGVAALGVDLSKGENALLIAAMPNMAKEAWASVNEMYPDATAEQKAEKVGQIISTTTSGLRGEAPRVSGGKDIAGATKAYAAMTDKSVAVDQLKQAGFTPQEISQITGGVTAPEVKVPTSSAPKKSFFKDVAPLSMNPVAKGELDQFGNTISGLYNNSKGSGKSLLK